MHAPEERGEEGENKKQNKKRRKKWKGESTIGERMSRW